jgi:hypothetical protein
MFNLTQPYGCIHGLPTYRYNIKCWRRLNVVTSSPTIISFSTETVSVPLIMVDQPRQNFQCPWPAYFLFSHPFTCTRSVTTTNHVTPVHVTDWAYGQGAHFALWMQEKLSLCLHVQKRFCDTFWNVSKEKFLLQMGINEARPRQTAYRILLCLHLPLLEKKC